ncbi:MAG TPA: AmmeMemoRadiSam system protein B [Desulfobacteraceae bacterium]|nr:AmmeMemoRadiSam system protein B [Desulfobacteraceae bacterium]
MTTRPKVRIDIDFIPVIHEEKRMILIRDDVGLVQEGLALPQNLFEFVAMLDGRRDIRDIQMELMRRNGGNLFDTDEIRGLLEKLDSWYLLDSRHFRESLARITAEFSALSVRPCAFSGRSYPGDKTELRALLEEIISSAKAPPNAVPSAIVAPHIDLAAGKTSYAAAYSLLKNTRPARVIVLGIGHRMTNGWFSLTLKDFETPLGVAGCDREAVLRLQKPAGDTIADNDFVHKSEHSIEFQVLFLQHLLPPDSFSIVPILCGALPADPESFGRDAYVEKAGGLLGALKTLTNDPGIPTLILAGVDFSHIGLKFGHSTPAASLEASASAHDRALLDRLAETDAAGFWQEIMRVKDRYNVCGFPALACLMEILPPSSGAVLDYGIYREKATGSAVTFAAAAFRATERNP